MDYKGLPVYFADVDESVAGISILSLVPRPAVESAFVCFDADLPIQLATNEEQHIVSGVALIPDFPIYRRDDKHGEFYMTFTKDAIERIVHRFFAEHNTTNITLNHEGNTQNCVIFESYLLNKERGIVPVEFADLPNGTWIVSTKVNDDALWAEIKAGKYTGFSVEGMLKTMLNPNNSTRMEKTIAKMREMLRSIFVKFGKVETDKGALYWSGDQILRVGDVVYKEEVKEGEEADYDRADDGEYTAADGRKIVVADGTVVTIEEGTEPNTDGKEVEMKEGDKPQDDPADKREIEKTDDTARIDALEAKVAEQAEAIEALREELTAKDAAIAEIKESIASLGKTPADDPADKKPKEGTPSSLSGYKKWL